MDAKLTLKRLHERFPELTTDDLLDILDCFEDRPIYIGYPYYNTLDYTVTCNK